MKYKNIKPLFLVIVILVVYFTLFKYSEATNFSCQKEIGGTESVTFKVSSTDTDISNYKVGVIKAIDPNPASANFDSSVSIDNGELNIFYFFDQLEENTDYVALIFEKTGSTTYKYIQILDDCTFSTPAKVKIIGACGSSKDQTFTAKPSTNLCSAGTATTVYSTSNGWKWKCKGQDGDSPDCLAKKEGVIGVSASSDGSDLVPGCPDEGCGLNELIKLINNIINFLLFKIATPLAALAFTYAGILPLTSGGNPETLSKAKKIIKNLLWGYVIALAAWLIINTIIKTLDYDASWIITKIKS